jgi:hypothetical protein
MHTTQILWLIALPVAIFLTYRVILIVLKKYEKKFPPDVEIKSDRDS